MSNPSSPASTVARIALLAAVLAAGAGLVFRVDEEGVRRVVSARLIPARPAQWPERAVDGLRIDTQVADGRGVPVVVVRPGDPPIRWRVDARPGARLRLGYRLRDGEGEEDSAAGAAEGAVTVAATWRAADGTTTELHRGTARALGSEDALEPLEVELPASGEGEIVLAADFAGGSGGDAAADRDVELVWIDPIVSTPDRAAPPNVVVICIDTLRADRFAAIGGGPSSLPLTEKRLASAAVFRRAYSNAPWTLPSVATVITGLHPGLHNAGRRTSLGPTSGRPTNYSATPTEGGIQLTIAGQDYRFQMLHPSVPTLHSLLGESGHVTGAIFRNGYLNHPTRIFLGADSFQHYTGEAPEGADLAIDWIGRHADESFYLFLHFIDPHEWPRRIAKRLRAMRPREFSQEDRLQVWGVYDELTRQADEHVDRVFRALARRGLLENTYVVLLADHGERFFEKGVRGSHGGDHYESVLRVPLAIWGPDVTPRTIDSRVSLADVTPTVLDLLDVDAEEPFSGASLVPWLEGRTEDRPVLSEFILWNEPQTALLRDGWKYIRRESREELYFLPEDPRESDDRAAFAPEVLAAMRAEVEDHLAQSDRRFASMTYGTTHLDAGTVGSLRALGYLE